MAETKKRDNKDVFTAMLLLPFAILVDGYVLFKMWNWFVAVPFEWQLLTVVQSCGITLLWRVGLHEFGHPTEGTKSLTEQTLDTMGVHGLVLFIAWVIHLFM